MKCYENLLGTVLTKVKTCKTKGTKPQSRELLGQVSNSRLGNLPLSGRSCQNFWASTWVGFEKSTF